MPGAPRSRRYESDPAVRDGPQGNCARWRKKYEHERDTCAARYHHYERASAALQDRHRDGVRPRESPESVRSPSPPGAFGIVGLIFMAIGYGRRTRCISC
jgi:hypothetical protein